MSGMGLCSERLVTHMAGRSSSLSPLGRYPVCYRVIYAGRYEYYEYKE